MSQIINFSINWCKKKQSNPCSRWVKNQTKPPPKSAEIRLSFFISGEIIKIFHNTCIIFLIITALHTKFHFTYLESCSFGEFINPSNKLASSNKVAQHFLFGPNWPRSNLHFGLLHWPTITLVGTVSQIVLSINLF